MLRSVVATRYVAPLREGGSLPALVEADDDGMYVVKLRGAGQGIRALIAEAVVGEIGRAAGLPIPELVVVEVDPALALGEPDSEIQELLERSAGTNLGMDYLSGAVAIGAPGLAGISPDLAADVVWFDALVMNIDRTPRNPNLLRRNGNLTLIDHGAALYQHHRWIGSQKELGHATKPFAGIEQHIFLSIAGSITEADARIAPRVTPEAIAAAVDAVPDEWLEQVPIHLSVEEHRAHYRAWFRLRMEAPRAWVAAAEEMRQAVHRG